MKKKATTLFVILMTFCMLSGCGHEHTWTEATCTTPKTCSECGETEGAPAGHVWMAATCTKPKTCSVCGETEGEAAGHKWEVATCTTPKKCSVCGQTEGEAVGHIWEEATCKTPRTCITCGQTDGKLGEHQLDSTGKCKVCNSQVGFKLNMSNYSSYFKFTFTNTKDSSGKITGFTAEIQPLKNVSFYNVTVFASASANIETISTSSKINGVTGTLQRNGTYKHKLTQKSTYKITLDKQGYGNYKGVPTIGDTQGISSFTVKEFTNNGIINITGYIVE